MNILSFAARNVMRNKRRSILAATSVFLSIFMVIVMKGFTDGFLDSLVRNYTKNETGHVNIATEGYRKRSAFMPIDEYIENSDALAARIVDSLAGFEGGAVAAQRIRFGVLLSSETGTKQAAGLAGDPETERGLLMLDSRILPGGKYCVEKGTAIVGAKLATDLGLKVGDPLKIVTQKADGGLGFKKLTISGLFQTGVNSVDEALFQMGLEDARELLGLEGSAQQIAVMLKRASFTEEATGRVREILKQAGVEGISVLPWTDIGEYPKLVKMVAPIYTWAFVIVALLGAFIIANVMTMVILERKREIGILMSMGIQKGRLLGLFLIEGSLLGFGGAFIGSLAGSALNIVFSKTGLDMTSAMAGFSWPLDNVIYPSTSPISIVVGTVLGTLVAALVAYLPSRRAARMAPVEAMRSI